MPPREPERGRGGDDGLDAVELAAAEWLVRQDRGLSRAQEDEFARWREADESHAQAYDRLHETWRMLDRVPAVRVPLPAARRRRSAWGWVALPLAAAATVAFLFVGRDPAPSGVSPLVQRAATPVGGLQEIHLPDGSVVRLNTSSQLDIVFTAAERRVHLWRGEANFAVARDPARPFIVRAGPVDVRAIGTEFNVRCRDDVVDVLVTEGRVRVDDAASGRSLLAEPESNARAATAVAPGFASAGATSEGGALLTHGQRVIIPVAVTLAPTLAPVAPISVTRDEMLRALAWRSRRLEFSDEPLANVVAEFNRYNRHQLVITDERLAAQRFGGRFPADDIESFVRLLESNFDVSAERREGETVLRRASALP